MRLHSFQIAHQNRSSRRLDIFAPAHTPVPVSAAQELRVRRSGCRTLELESEVVDIAVVPILSRLKRPDDGVAHALVVGGRVLSRRVVAAPDMSALLAPAPVPPVRAT